MVRREVEGVQGRRRRNQHRHKVHHAKRGQSQPETEMTESTGSQRETTPARTESRGETKSHFDVNQGLHWESGAESIRIMN